MKLLGKTIVVSESAKRNLCLLPAAVALFGVMVKESCAARRLAPETGGDPAALTSSGVAGRGAR
jgi:hypothetical protein